MNYWKWNTALGDFFFRNSRKGQRILFYLDRKLIDRIGQEQGLPGWEDFCASVRQGPLEASWPHYLPELVQVWSDGPEFHYPFFLNGIAALILAHTERPHPDMGYYESLAHFGKHHLHSTADARSVVPPLVNAFAHIREWSEAWPEVPGTFIDEPIQEYRYVGRIRHHALISPAERRNLHLIWRDLTLEPGQGPHLEWLIYTLEQHPESASWIPGMLTLFGHRSPEVRKVVHHWLLEELRTWDGSAPPTPQLYEPPFEEGFALRMSWSRRVGMGLRLHHPDWSGEVTLRRKEAQITLQIGADGWSRNFTFPGGGINFTAEAPEIRVQMIQPVPRELSASVFSYYYPADALGTLGSDYIGHDRMLRERPLQHCFPARELASWRQWAKEHRVENWRAKEAPAGFPPGWKFYAAEQIPPPETSPGAHLPRVRPPAPLSKVFPLSAAHRTQQWQYAADGRRLSPPESGIGHFFLDGVEHRCVATCEWTLDLSGKADPPPPEADRLAPLLAKRQAVIPFRQYYDLLQAIAAERGESLDTVEARYYRRLTAALGYFFEDSPRQQLQLAPPAFALLPDNHHAIRASLTGIWTADLRNIVVQWCQDPAHGLQLAWEESTDPYLPAAGFLTCFRLDYLVALHAELERRFPGVVGRWTPCSYSQALIERLTVPRHRGWFSEAEGLRKQVGSPEAHFLSPEDYRFIPQTGAPIFPMLTRSYHEWYGYPIYTWWESEQQGHDCNGNWAVWRLLHAHGVPVLFSDHRWSDHLLLPVHLPLPALVRRALTMASGLPGSPETHPLPGGPELTWQRYPNIRYPIRRHLPRLLLGATGVSAPESFFHRLHPQPHNHGPINQ
ncbi:MAG: hypothetical protein AAF998_11050 [Bacteroidota bacterium]